MRPGTATQFACCAGLLMLPLYFLAAAWSWLLTGDFGTRNVFERRAGLAGGGYADRPLRPAVARWLAGAAGGGRGQAHGGRAGGRAGGPGGSSGRPAAVPGGQA
jgi:hypothetical protein